MHRLTTCFLILCGSLLILPPCGATTNISQVGNSVDIKILSGSQTKIAVDGSGKSYVVWLDATTAQILGAVQTQESTWSPPIVISQDDFVAALPVISVSASGNGVIAWQSKSKIRARLVVDGVFSNTISTLSEGGAVSGVTCASNSAGHAVVVWNDAQRGVFGSVYDGSAWSSASVISPPSFTKNSYGGSRVGMDAAGNAVVIYENATNPNYKAIDAARYIVNTGWFYETLSNHELPGEINERSLAVSENGEAVAVWRLQNTLTYHLYYSVLPNISQGSWIPPKTISLPTAGYGALDATAAINASGYAIILWDRSQSKNGVYAIHKLPGTTDFIMQSQTVESATNAITPRVNIDAEGNALVSWYDINLKGVYTSQKIKMGDSWSPPKLVSEANQANIKYPQNAVGPLGHAQVVWSNQLLNGTTQNVIQGLDSALLINQ